MNDKQLQLLSLQRRHFLTETSDGYQENKTSLCAAVESYYRCKNWDGLLGYLDKLQIHHLLVDAWKWQIGQMYIYTGEPQKAIDYLFPIHCRRPLQQEIQLVIAEALYMMGKKSEQFHWIYPPQTQKVAEEQLLHCLEWLTATGRAVPLYFLHNCITDKRGPDYNSFDLVMALKQDDRFSVINSTPYYRYSFVEMKKNGGAAQNAAPLSINWNSDWKTLCEPSL